MSQNYEMQKYEIFHESMKSYRTYGLKNMYNSIMKLL